MTTPVFVYERDHEIRVEYSEIAAALEQNGWTLIASLEPRAYIKHLLIKYSDLVRELKGESYENK